MLVSEIVTYVSKYNNYITVNIEGLYVLSHIGNNKMMTVIFMAFSGGFDKNIPMVESMIYSIRSMIYSIRLTGGDNSSSQNLLLEDDDNSNDDDGATNKSLRY